MRAVDVDMIFKWWRKCQRETDMKILWPVCKETASTLDDAKFAFFWHITNDAAWTKDFNLTELMEFTDNLK